MKAIIADWLLATADSLLKKKDSRDVHTAKWKSAKDFTIIFCACFAFIFLSFAFIPFMKSGVPEADAKSQDVVKFAKVEDDLHGSSAKEEVVKGLAGSTGGVQKAERDKSAYTAIHLSSDEQKSEDRIYANCLANVRGKAEDDGKIIGEVKYGEEVKVVGEENGYAKIPWGEDGYGFINKSCLDGM